MRLELIPGYDRPAELLSLFTEYTRMLVSHDQLPGLSGYPALCR